MQIPTAARSELAPSGKLRVGLNYGNFLQTVFDFLIVALDRNEWAYLIGLDLVSQLQAEATMKWPYDDDTNGVLH